MRTIAAGTAALAVIAALAIAGCTPTTAAKTSSVATSAGTTSATPAAAPAPAPTPTPTPAGPVLTVPQQNAAAEALQYLSSQAFSRLGLIGQLSSSFGSGYKRHDATVAVRSLHVNWRHEAARSAREYLQTQPFSCSGLIEQLDSSSGEQFTVAQATYGAGKSGVC